MRELTGRRAPGGTGTPGGGDAGFTLIEVLIASTVLLIVLALCGAALISLTKAGNTGEALVQNEQTVTTVLTQLDRELRSADPLLQLSSAATPAACSSPPTTTTTVPAAYYSAGVEFQLRDPTTGADTTIAWVFDPSCQTLVREVLGSGGAITSSAVELTGVLNPPSEPVFTYLDGAGTNLVAQGSPPATVATCTTNVQVTVMGQSDPGPQPFQEQTDVQLRNQLAYLAATGGNPCQP